MSSTLSRLGSYSVLLVGLFATAYAVGEKLPGHEHTGDSVAHTDSHADSPTGAHESSHSSMGDGDAGLGLVDTVDGTRLVTDSVSATSVSFHLERAGAPVTSFIESHGAMLHLVLVKIDLTGFQHLHPVLAADGTWTTAADLGEPGRWRLIADSRPGSMTGPIVLGTALTIAGTEATTALPAAADTVDIGGLTVERHGLDFSVSPADQLEPYLGQAAHLIALRAGDVAYLHLHPEADTLGNVKFAGALPGPGTYRLFLQFGNAGDVVTVPFTAVQA
ncbi:MAG: hypothetical protein AAB131_17335 [Actinomycetota bacterium]